MKWRIPVTVVSAMLFLWGILPFMIAGIVNVGVITSVAIGLVGILASVFHAKTEKAVLRVIHGGRGVRIAAVAVGSIVVILVLLFIVVSVIMVCNAARSAPDGHVTLVVPGAKINGEHPSLMLYGRLQAAAEFLEQHPTVNCVVSGGQGEDEPCSEASVMRRYLIEMGVDAARIYVEEQSTNTFENMQYTYQVIKQHDLPTRVVIATQEFHQYRCAAYAREAALEPVGTATCATPWYLFLCYWVREFAGISRMWLLGY